MRPERFTDEYRQKFLDLLRQHGNVTLAAEALGFERTTVYVHRAQNESFASEWDAAIAEAADRLEAEAWRRAVEGVDEPVFGRVAKDKDGQIGTIRRYSDALMARLLSAHKPEKYRERKEVQLGGSLDIAITEVVIERLVQPDD